MPFVPAINEYRARRAFALLAGAVLIALTLSTQAAPALAGQVHIGSSIRSESLSNEVGVTRVAYARRAAPIRRGPHARSRTSGRLEFVTSDGQALPYVLLRRIKRSHGSAWIRIRVPGRPNGQKGWVRESALGSSRIIFGHLLVNRSRSRATLFGRHGEVRWTAPVGTGRPGLGTPRGHFWITERLRSIGGSEYGPYAFGTSAYAPHLTDWPGGGVIGIHGTDEPGLIPGRPSHGCVRVRNPAIRVLWRKLDVGTPVRIR